MSVGSRASRIVTLTLNPTIDVGCDAAAVRPIHKIRTFKETDDPGGGGINVSRVVHELGGETLAVVLAGGFTGKFLEELLMEEGVPSHVVPIGGRTRLALTVHDLSSRLEYRFVPEGPIVAEDEWRAALDVLNMVEAGWIVASGSLPRGVPEDFYVRVAEIAARRGRRFALDTSGPALRAALGHGIALIKPSLGEFEALLGRTLREPDEQEAAAADLVRAGAADMVAVTCGRDGALLATRGGVLRQDPVPVEALGAVGAGDSFLAALVLALDRGCSAADALAWGAAAGAAAVTRTGTAHPARADVETLHRRIAVVAD